MENKGLQLEDLKVSNLPELKGWKEKQEKLVEENPYVEIIDNKTYELACKSRTALLKGRTELEKQDKLIASKVASFRKDVKTETDILIAITLPSEEKQQSEVKRYESIKEAEKAEKERLEQQRIDGIKKRIENFETDSYRIIQDTTIEDVDLHKTMLDALVEVDFDYEEYDILFEQAKSRVQISWDLKCSDIQEKEAQRLENERLELQNKRLVEIMPYVSYGEQVDLTKLSELSDFDYNSILASKTSLFEADQLAKQEAEQKLIADNAEKEAKAKLEKEAVFEIRKNRLAEIGVLFDVERDYFITTPKDWYSIDKESVLDAYVIEFENIISDAKSSIEKAKSDAEEAEKQKTIDENLAKEDAERLKKENKARVKRLAADKKIISESLGVYFADLHLETENQETKDFIEIVNTKIKALKNELLTELENL